MNKMIIKWLHGMGASVTALVFNILMSFVVYMICRLVYLLENHAYFVDGLSFSAMSDLIKGGFIFDRSAVFYTHSLYIC